MKNSPNLQFSKSPITGLRNWCNSCVVEESLLRIQLDAYEHVDDRLADVRAVIDVRRGIASVPDLRADGVRDRVGIVVDVDDVFRAEPALLPASDVDHRR